MNLPRTQDIDTQVMDLKVPFLLSTISKHPNISENRKSVCILCSGNGQGRILPMHPLLSRPKVT